MSTKKLSDAKKIAILMVIIVTILSLYVYLVSPYVNDYIQTKFPANAETIKYIDNSKDMIDVGLQLYEAGVQRGVYESLDELIKYGVEDFNTKRVIDRAMKTINKGEQ